MWDAGKVVWAGKHHVDDGGFHATCHSVRTLVRAGMTARSGYGPSARQDADRVNTHENASLSDFDFAQPDLKQEVFTQSDSSRMTTWSGRAGLTFSCETR